MQAGAPAPQQEVLLTELDFGGDFGIHQGRAAVRVDDLAGDPGGLAGAEERDDIADVFRRTQAAHRGPAAGVPVADESLSFGRKRVEDAVFGPTGADRVYRDATLGQSDGEVADQRFHRGFRGAHSYPRLKAAGAAAFGRSEEHTSEL